MKRIVSLVLCFLLTFILCQTVLAEGSNITWTGSAGNKSWHNAENWNPQQVPVDGDFVTIPESSVVEYAYGQTSVRLTCAGNLTVSGGTLKLASGNSSLTNGKLDGAGDIIITTGGNLSWGGGSIEGPGKLIIENYVNLYAIDSSSLDRYLVNNGSLLINNSLILTGGAEGSGNFNPQEGQTLELGGGGSYDLSTLSFSNMGTLKLANTCEFVRFNNNYTQQNTGTLEFDIGGLDDFTKLEVTGTVILNGVLKINVLDGYVPSPDDSFEVITYGSKTGTFSSIESNMPGITFEPAYTDTGLTLTVQEAATVPSAPQDLTATPGDGRVTLSWAAPDSNGGSEITHYEVSSDNGTTWVTASTSTSHTFTGLTNGTEYNFKVRAVNSAGPGAEAGVTATPAATPVPPEFAGGSGSEEEPYLIETVDQLNNVRNYLGTEHSDKHFKLNANLDLDVAPYNSGAGWEPIGTSASPFTGSFDGGGYTISGLVIKQVGVWNVRIPAGLFGYIGAGAEISDLVLEDVDVTGCYFVGGLAGKNNGEIIDVNGSGDVVGEWETGGLVGVNNGSISDSCFIGTVTGTDVIEYGEWTGGLVGNNLGTILTLTA